MTFIDLASIGCGRYEGFWTIAQLWPTVRRHTAAAHQKTQILAYGRTEAKTSKSDDNERNHFKWKGKIFLASDFHKEFKSSWYNTPKSKRKYKHRPTESSVSLVSKTKIFPSGCHVILVRFSSHFLKTWPVWLENLTKFFLFRWF